MGNSKKVAGIAVFKQSGMIGRIISDAERQMLLDDFGSRFQTPVKIAENCTIGKTKSDTGIAFRALPESAIFGVIVTDPGNDCEFLVYADAELSEAMQVVSALGGLSTFTEEVVHLGNTYSATYPGGSGSWDPICL